MKAVDFAAFARAAGRQKTPPAFDGLALDSGENQEFGTDTVDAPAFHRVLGGAQHGEGCQRG